MRLMQAIYMTLIVAFVDCFSGCVSTVALKDGKVLNENSAAPAEKKKKDFHRLAETSVSVDNNGELNADIFRPDKKIEPKTLVIMVPGAGNISRKGEVSGDGINNYDAAIPMNELWAEALADRGMFVLSYDKRTCTKSINPICRTNDQSSIDASGMEVFARDLDRVVDFVRGKLNARGDDVRIVLMSTTQGAQTIILSESAKTAHGIILLSPIVTDLETMWTTGLMHAAKDASPNQKTRLLSQRESMLSFFKSLKANEFPETSIIRGASAKLWRSWVDASNQTVDVLAKHARPTLFLFSTKDSFSSTEALASVTKKISKSKKISIKNIQQVDRNFITKDGVPTQALEPVIAFINGLSLTP